MGVVVPFMPYDELRQTAERFLTQYHPSREIPVPIEAIVEFQFNMDIVTIPGLHLNYEIDSMISKDLQQIMVDETVFKEFPGRYRFSLAHEIGHRIMHARVFEELEFRTVDQWKEVMECGIGLKEYSSLEFQAYAFAGLVLVPGKELEHKFRSTVELVASHGLTLDAESDTTRQMVARYLAKDFGVSSAVIEKRLGYDNLWQK